MNLAEHLQTCIAEECGEIVDAALAIQKVFHKSLRFGFSDVNPEDLKTKKEILKKELNDMLAAIELLVEIGFLDEVPIDFELIDAKKKKILSFIKIPVLTERVLADVES